MLMAEREVEERLPLKVMLALLESSKERDPEKYSRFLLTNQSLRFWWSEVEIAWDVCEMPCSVFGPKGGYVA